MEKVLVKTFLIKIFIWLQSDVIFDETVTQATIIARDFFLFLLLILVHSQEKHEMIQKSLKKLELVIISKIKKTFQNYKFTKY